MDDRARLTVSEFFSLLWLNFTVQLYQFKEFLITVCKYYSNFSFLKADISLRLMYLFHNPFTISKRFLMAKGEKEIYAYGETPLTTLENIAKECQLSKQDCVYELGCGRGRTCFWLRSFLGCSVVGIEFVPEFVELAQRIVDKLQITHLTFKLEDMLKSDLLGATVCYLYGTNLKEEAICTLIDTFAKLPAGTKIITVSYPLTDYTDSPNFELMKCFPATFPWGTTEVFLHIVKRPTQMR